MRKYEGLTFWVMLEIEYFGNNNIVITASMNGNSLAFKISGTILNLSKATGGNFVRNIGELILFHSRKMHGHSLL